MPVEAAHDLFGRSTVGPPTIGSKFTVDQINGKKNMWLKDPPQKEKLFGKSQLLV